MLREFLWAVVALLAAAPARAEWREVRTDHFLLTINDTEEGAREFATRLERFDSAMRRLYSVPDSTDRHLNPLRIYALEGPLFYRVCGCPGAAGVYRPQVAGSYIYSLHMPGIDRKTKTGWWSSQTVLLHEYSHHFAYSSFPMAYPYWFSEGFAEFNAQASFETDGSIIIGYPANYRAEGLKSGNHLSPKQLFEPERYSTEDFDLLYGRGWLLTHYLMLHPGRRPQLVAYLTALNSGKRSLEAAEAAFGDLKQLNLILDAYQRGKLAPPLRIAPAPEAPKMTMRSLPPGEAAMLPYHLLATTGINKEYRYQIALEATKTARRYPDDPIAQERLAEIELAADRMDDAQRAIDAALAGKPDLMEGLLYKGLIVLRAASEGKTPDAKGWLAARPWFVKANRADPSAAMPLYLYYESFVGAKAAPPAAAVNALKRAEVLAPEATEVRMALARQMLLDGDAQSARVLLQPVAFTPHSKDNAARRILDLIDAGKIAEAKAAFDKPDARKDD